MEEYEGKEYFIPVKKETLLENFRGKENILVISPHPDDDVLAAGGSMAAASDAGKGVFSVYITDGRRSWTKSEEGDEERMASLRAKEAIAALQRIGAVGGFFLQERSEELIKEEGQRIERALIKILQWIQPGEVFLPAPYERHLTHQRCSRLAFKSLRSVPAQKPHLLGYSLWGSFWGAEKRVVRDISPFIQKKIQAIQAHRSQIAFKNYSQGILGKSNYEVIFGESHEPQKMVFVEIFLTMNELLENPNLTLEDFIRQDVESFIRAFL